MIPYDPLHGLDEESRLRCVRSILQVYDTFLPNANLWYTLRETIPGNVFRTFQPLIHSVPAHAIINNILLRHYRGERTVKALWSQIFLPREDLICAYEIIILGRRLDFAVFAEHESHVYEIKTELDSLTRLPHQIEEGLAAFDRMTLLVHFSHLEKVRAMAPEEVGILPYTLDEHGLHVEEERVARHHDYTTPQIQLIALTSNELLWIIRQLGIKPIPRLRKDKERIILEHLSHSQINLMFNRVMRKRYAPRWNHLRLHAAQIQSIDLQSFFASAFSGSGADPSWVYGKNEQYLSVF